MALSFQTPSQEMTFVDEATLQLTQPGSLIPGHTYDVFLVVQNNDTLEHQNVQVEVSHSAFGIGLPGGTTYITEPMPVTVPPALGGIDGTATVEFQFTAPPGGHGCLTAIIVGTNPLAVCGQNVTSIGVPRGTNAELSFMVFGNAATAETMHLTLSELANGAPVPAAQSWHPLIVAPPGTGPAGPTPAPVDLNLAANGFYSVGLQVTLPPTAVGTHVFHITGTVNGIYVGDVDITVNALATSVPRPAPYVVGGYTTPDIILIDPLTGTPVIAAPGTDFSLRPNTNYGFKAQIHNASPTPATNTVVRFWYFPGGVGSAGTLIDVQSTTIPAWGTTIVTSNHPFPSAPAGGHRCAVVSIYNSLSTTAPVDAITAAMVADPSFDVAQSSSAWHNTDSMWVRIGAPWHFQLEANVPEHVPGPGPVEIEVEALAVPRDFDKHPELTLVRDSLLAAGASIGNLYLLNSLQPLLTPAPLGIKLGGRSADANGAERAASAVAVAAPPIAKAKGTLKLGSAPVPFTVEGIVPADAREGDVYLVRVTARYAAAKGGRARTVAFTKQLNVVGKG
jgi:hypothetical protein